METNVCILAHVIFRERQLKTDCTRSLFAGIVWGGGVSPRLPEGRVGAALCDRGASDGGPETSERCLG